jgi:hypothetical protein
MKAIRMTEKVYLLLLSILLIAVSIVVLSLATPNSLGYNLALSLISTGITVFFLDLMLTIREERDWRNVKKYAYLSIATENSVIFSELLRYIEIEGNELLFKLSLSQFNDKKVRSDMIFAKLLELQKKESFKLSSYAMDFNSNKESLKLLLEAKNKLADIQVRYSSQLRDPTLIEKLQQIQNGIELLTLNGQLGSSLPKIKSQVTTIQNNLQNYHINAPFADIIKNANLEDFNKLTELGLELPIKSLINEIIELWNMGIEFSIV